MCLDWNYMTNQCQICFVCSMHEFVGQFIFIHEQKRYLFLTFFPLILFCFFPFIHYLREAMGKILARGHSRVPVYSGNPKNIIGLLLVGART